MVILYSLAYLRIEIIYAVKSKLTSVLRLRIEVGDKKAITQQVVFLTSFLELVFEASDVELVFLCQADVNIPQRNEALTSLCVDLLPHQVQLKLVLVRSFGSLLAYLAISFLELIIRLELIFKVFLCPFIVLVQFTAELPLRVSLLFWSSCCRAFGRFGRGFGGFGGFGAF